MRLRRIDPDLLSQGPRHAWAEWVLAFVAIAFAIDVASNYLALREQEASVLLERSLQARLDAPRARGLAKDAQVPSDTEIAFARATLRRFATPWDRLLASLESARSKDIALLSVDPDRDTGLVSISAEARDYAGALAYVGTLERSEGFSEVRLVRHQAHAGTQSGERRATHFVVSARWIAEP